MAKAEVTFFAQQAPVTLPAGRQLRTACVIVIYEQRNIISQAAPTLAVLGYEHVFVLARLQSVRGTPLAVCDLFPVVLTVFGVLRL
jgi:hypothetical protein